MQITQGPVLTEAVASVSYWSLDVSEGVNRTHGDVNSFLIP